jgi:hypothetical protein
MGAPAFYDEKAIRKSAVTYRVPCITTMSGARAAADAVAAKLRDPIECGACRKSTKPRRQSRRCWWGRLHYAKQKNPADVSPPGRVVSI